jgi:hypothetical protein
MAKHGNLDQFTIALPSDLRSFIEHLAEMEGRTLSGLVRVWVTEAAQRAGWTNGAGAPWPPALRLPSSLEEARAEHAKVTQRFDALIAFQGRGGHGGTGLLPHEDEELRCLRDRRENLGNFIRSRERTENVA